MAVVMIITNGKIYKLEVMFPEMNENICEVVENVFLGDYTAATSPETLCSLGIRHVLSLDVARPPLPAATDQLFLQVADTPETDLLSHLPVAVAWLGAATEAGARVLVHCRHGLSRSPAVVLALLVSRGWELEAALARVQAARSAAEPNPGFMDQLRLWERMEGRLDPASWQYCYFLLQRGEVREQQAAEGPQPGRTYKCRKCRRLVAVSSQVIPHRRGSAPSWAAPEPAAGPDLCAAGILLTPPACRLPQTFNQLKRCLDLRRQRKRANSTVTRN
jgi:dual specificity phosphatase 12